MSPVFINNWKLFAVVTGYIIVGTRKMGCEQLLFGYMISLSQESCFEQSFLFTPKPKTRKKQTDDNENRVVIASICKALTGFTMRLSHKHDVLVDILDRLERGALQVFVSDSYLRTNIIIAVTKLARRVCSVSTSLTQRLSIVQVSNWLLYNPQSLYVITIYLYLFHHNI